MKRGLHTIFTVTLLACVLYCNTSFAQRYPFYNLNVENGLIQSQAMCMTQDQAGNLWIGTLGGLARFDGKEFTNYSVRNGMLNNSVDAVTADKDGNIWIGGPAGLSVYNGKTFHHYKLQQQENRSSNSSQEIKILNDTTWWRVFGVLYRITKDKYTYVQTPGQGNVSAILAMPGGVWVAKNGDIYRLNGKKWDTLSFNLPQGAMIPYIYKIYQDKGKQIWLTTTNGLYNVVQGKILPHPVYSPQLPYLPQLLGITEDNAGAIWIGTSSGAIKLTGNNAQYYNKKNGLTDNTIFDVLTDAEGNIWLASDGQGIFRFSGTRFTGLDETMGLPSAQIMAIAADKSGKLFLGTYDAGLYTFDNGSVSPLSFPSNPTPIITSMCYTHDSKLWIGTKGRGLWRYDNIFTQYALPERKFPSNFITALYEDTAKRLWIGFVDGAMVYERDTFRTILTKNSSVEAFLTIGSDSVLMATEKKLLLYNNGTVSHFITNGVIDSSSVQCFTMRGRELWIGTSDNGVICYNLDTKRSYSINKNNGLRSDFIYNIVVDNDRNIWLGTGFGIHRVTTNGNNLPTIAFFGKSQGITGMESNQNSVLKMHDGSIWFGTTNGALHYQPHSVVVSSHPTSIVMQSVKLPGENIIETNYFDSTDNWYGVPYHLHLPYKKNNITFTFQAITLGADQQLQYRYRIDGLDAPWSDWSTTNSVTYSALPPGKYVFKVECNTADGQQTKDLEYPFEIITPFQKTKWFRFAIFGACILLGIVLQYIVNSRKQRRLKLLEKLRREEQGKIRMRTAEDFHDEVGNKLTRINVLTNILKQKIIPNPDTTRILNQIEDNTNQLYGGTRDILWSLKPSNDNLYEILYRIRDFGNELFGDTDVKFIFTGNDEKWKNYRLPMDMSRNLIMIFKEALNNCLKYSKATEVSMDIAFKGKDGLQIILRDNGIGFDMKNVKRGHGINNMNVRAERIHGRLHIDSRENKGTITNLTFKIPLNR